MKTELQFGIQPFWFWNGEMKEDEITRQIDQMHRQGLKGFLIHPRQGLEIPYLSREYFRRVRHAAEEAKKREMEVWIYDEFPYPSGTGGGKVLTEHPEFLCRELKRETKVVCAGEPVRMNFSWGKLLFAKAYPYVDGTCVFDAGIDLRDAVGPVYTEDVYQESGLTAYNHKRFFQGDLAQGLLCTLPSHSYGTGVCRWKLYIYTEAILQHFKYFGQFVDPLNSCAVRCFLDCVHERYKQEIGDLFQDTVKGFFTDEVTAFPPEQPWSPLLPRLILERHGIDILESLPALTEDMGPESGRVRYAYRETVTHQFMESYDRQLLAWCHQNGLRYIGEKPILRSEELKYVDIPGIDTGHMKVGEIPELATDCYRSNGKVASSATHFYKKEGTLCEAFHSIGWGMTIQDMKWIYDWLAVMGADWHITHGAYYTSDGLRKHDAPPSMFYQMPWWENHHILAEYEDQKKSFFQNCRREVSLLILDPVTSFWYETPGQEKIYQKKFGKLQEDLLRHGIDYYIIDPLLFREGKTVTDTAGVYYQIHGENFAVLLVPYMRNLSDELRSLLAAFQEAGGTILYAEDDTFETGKLPKETKKIVSSEHRKKNEAQKKQLYFTETEAIMKRVKELLPESWNVSADKELDGALVFVQLQDTDTREHKLFLVNLGKNTGRIMAGYSKNKSCETVLAPFEAAYFQESEGRILQLTFQKEAKKNGCIRLSEKPAYEYELSLDGIWKQKPGRWNILRIDSWEMEIGEKRTAKVPSIPVIDQMELTGTTLPVKTSSWFGCPKELVFSPVVFIGRYSFICDGSWIKERHLADPPDPLFLCYEPGTFFGEWKLSVNGKTVTEKDFHRKEVFLPTNQVFDISEWIRQGENELELTIRTDRSFGGIRNCLYLCGDFGVFQRQGKQFLTTLPQTGRMKDLTGSGLPYYSGKLRFQKNFDLAELGKRHTGGDSKAEEASGLRLSIRDLWLQDSLRLIFNGQDLGCAAWSPYVWECSAGYLKEKENQVILEMDTSMIRLFEGQFFQRKSQSYQDVMPEENIRE